MATVDNLKGNDAVTFFKFVEEYGRMNQKPYIKRPYHEKEPELSRAVLAATLREHYSDQQYVIDKMLEAFDEFADPAKETPRLSGQAALDFAQEIFLLYSCYSGKGQTLPLDSSSNLINQIIDSRGRLEITRPILDLIVNAPSGKNALLANYDPFQSGIERAQKDKAKAEAERAKLSEPLREAAEAYKAADTAIGKQFQALSKPAQQLAQAPGQLDAVISGLKQPGFWDFLPWGKTRPEKNKALIDELTKYATDYSAFYQKYENHKGLVTQDKKLANDIQGESSTIFRFTELRNGCDLIAFAAREGADARPKMVEVAENFARTVDEQFKAQSATQRLQPDAAMDRGFVKPYLETFREILRTTNDYPLRDHYYAFGEMFKMVGNHNALPVTGEVVNAYCTANRIPEYFAGQMRDLHSVMSGQKESEIFLVGDKAEEAMIGTSRILEKTGYPNNAVSHAGAQVFTDQSLNVLLHDADGNKIKHSQSQLALPADLEGAVRAKAADVQAERGKDTAAQLSGAALAR